MRKKVKVKSPKKLITTGFILIVLVGLIIFGINSISRSNKDKQIEVSSKETKQIEATQNTTTNNTIKELNTTTNESNITLSNTVKDTNATTNNTTKDINTTTSNTTKDSNTTTNSTTKDLNTTTNNTSKNSNTSSSNTTKNTNNSTDPKYYIKVNVQENVVTIYEKDEQGEYTVPVKAILCSTGTATPEPGEICTMPNDKWNRYPWGTMVGGVYAQYYSRIKGNILFHSVPYTAEKKNALEYEEYDKLGTKASAGCIRMTVINAKWIYDNCPPGTQVEFYASDDPGPLGKPTEQKISNADAKLRCWDPTDPDKNNPWNK